MENSLIDKSSFLLCIRCMTYNQSAYITDALNGFTMQQTNFPFVAVVVDDASTDGEQKVIKTYLKEHFDHSEETGYKEWETEDAFWTFARNAENKNCYFVVVLLKQNLFGNPKKDELIREWCDTKYIALCEGDDYWTDPLKLEKQVDFLEEHEEYSMCFHGANLLNECGAEVTSSYHTIREGDYGPNDIFPMWVVPTASVVYRNELISDFQIKHGEWFVFSDIVLFEKCVHVGKVYGFAKAMSVYRMNAGSLVQNSKYQKDRSHKMPNHFRALKLNFPLINRTVLRQLMADSYYARMRNESNVLTMVCDFSRFVLSCPRYSFQKLCSKLKNRKVGHGSEK